MNDSQIKITPYSGWSIGKAERLTFLFFTLFLCYPYFYAVPNSWPKPLEVSLLAFLGVFFLCWCAYFICRFTTIDEQQITSGWRIWLLGDFFKSSVPWSAVQHAEVWPNHKSLGGVLLNITTRAGQRFEFSAPRGIGADALYAIHQQYKNRTT